MGFNRGLTFLSVFLFLSNALAEKGFYKPSDHFDESVYGAVYKLQTGLYFSRQMNTQGEYEELLSANSEHATLPTQIKDCWQEEASSCLLNLGMAVNGSLVAVEEDGEQVVWTNLHLVRNFILEWVKNSGLTDKDEVSEALKNVNIPLYVTDHSGEVVFDSYSKNSTQKAKLIVANWSMFVPDNESSFLGTPDAVKLKLSSSLPFELQKGSSSNVGDDVFVLGFPKPTENRQVEYGVPDSDGQSQYITFGKSVSGQSLQAEYNLDPLVIRFVINESYDYALDSDCEQGMSGGAMLNTHGEFVGLFRGIYAPKEIGPIACLGIKPQSLRFLENVSN